MSRNLLKTELTILERQFPRTHGVFQMISTSSEELVCQFTDIKQKKHTFQCNLSVGATSNVVLLSYIALLVFRQPSYPRILPLWTSDSDHPFVTALVEDLNASDEVSVGASHPVRIIYTFQRYCLRVDILSSVVVQDKTSYNKNVWTVWCEGARSGSRVTQFSIISTS